MIFLFDLETLADIACINQLHSNLLKQCRHIMGKHKRRVRAKDNRNGEAKWEELNELLSQIEVTPKATRKLIIFLQALKAK